MLTCQSPNLIDNSLNAFTLTKAGDVSVQKFSPFATVTQTPQTYSTYFDGTGDYLTVPFNSALNMGTGNFTIEFWVRTTSTAAYATGLRLGDSWTTGSWSLYLNDANGSGIPSWWSQTLGTTLSTSGATINDGAWHHIALVRNSTTMTMYIDGTSRGTLAVSTSSIGDTTTQLWIGRDASNVRELAGYISNLRVVKGTALYTANFTPATAPLTAIANTSLLTCQSSTLIDNSTNQFAITAVGDTKPRQQNPFGFTTSSTQDYTPTTFGGSAYFDGSSDYISIPTGAAAAFGTTGTVEFWYYPITSPATARIINNATTPAAGVMDVYDAYSVIGFGNAGYTTSTVKLNTWTHIACVINAGVLKIYFNGVSQPLTGTTTGYNLTATGDVWVGGINGYSQWTNGYVSDVRFVKGQAVYTANFVPPQAPLTAVTNTTLLLNMDKSAITDKSGKINLECVGDTKFGVEQPFAGTYYSNYFDGTGDYLSTANNVATNLGTGDFTVEFWLNASVTQAGSNPRILSNDTWNTSAGFDINIESSLLQFRSGGGTGKSCTFTTTDYGIWQHIAFTRSGTSFKVFKNGVLANTYTDSSNLTSANPTYIGKYAAATGSDFTGYISNLRIVKGTAVYTTAFTPSTQPLTAVANTQLLTCQSNRLIDNSTNAFAVTKAGDTAVRTFNPWQRNIGGSMYFDGSDYLIFPASAALAPRTGDFTIELWAYHLDTSVYATYFQQGNAGGGIIIRRNSSNKLEVSHNSVVAVATSTANIQANQWTHIAVSRSGTTFRTFIDGVIASNVTYAGDFNDMTTHYIGTTQAIAGYYMNGYIDDLRITKGYARYTANFTPPTSALLTK